MEKGKCRRRRTYYWNNCGVKQINTKRELTCSSSLAGYQNTYNNIISQLSRGAGMYLPSILQHTRYWCIVQTPLSMCTSSKVHAVFLSSTRDFTQAQLLAHANFMSALTRNGLLAQTGSCWRLKINGYVSDGWKQFLVSDPTTSVVENVRNGACWLRSSCLTWEQTILFSESLFSGEVGSSSLCERSKPWIVKWVGFISM